MDQLTINSPEVRDLQQRMIDRNVFLTSTLAIYEASVPTRAYASDATLRAMAPELIEDYRERRRSFDLQMQDSVRNRRLQKIMQFEYQYFKMGGLLCSGVDAGRHVLPGFGDQRNYILLLESGFNAEEAIQIMSGNGAMALGRSDIGMIQAGRRADFVILDGDLHHDPSVIKKIKTVFKSGIGYDPEKILNETVGKFGLD